MVNIPSDEPRYRKRSKKRGDPRAKHKHEYKNCVFQYPSIRFDKAHGLVNDAVKQSIGTFCPVCGKVGSVIDSSWLIEIRGYVGLEVRWNDAALSEFNEKTRTLPFFVLDEEWFPKYIPGYKNTEK